MKELLKKYLGEDESKINAFLEDMKANKIFTASEENLDVRYQKQKDEFEALKNQNKESLDLIEQMKKSTKDNEDLQGKITAYETKIAELEKQNEELAVDNALKFKLLEKGAKSSDIDYLIFRIKQGDTELKLDKEGNVKGLDDLVDGLKKNYSSNFEDKQAKKVDVKDLPDGDGETEVEPTSLAEAIKMQYEQK